MRFKYRPSKTKAREFAQEMDRIDQFCSENGIDHSNLKAGYKLDRRGRRKEV